MSSVRPSILHTLNQRGPLSIEEIARAIGISKMATRYHLRLLTQENLIATHVKCCGAVGRPCKLYALTEKAHAQLPQGYAELVEHLLDELEHSLGERQTRALLRRAGKRAALPAAQAEAGIQARLNRTARFLSRSGYAARVDRAPDALALVVYHCPYRTAARRYPAVCEMDRAMIGALMQTDTRMTCCIAAGHAECRFLVSRRDQEKV